MREGEKQGGMGGNPYTVLIAGFLHPVGRAETQMKIIADIVADLHENQHMGSGLEKFQKLTSVVEREKG